MTTNELQTLLVAHKEWLKDNTKGRRADLQGACLQCADLQCVNLQGADLQGADLQCADLQGANLQGARNIPQVVLDTTNILPSGYLIGWKKCRQGVIVKLAILARTPRSCATGRKCRAQSAKVLQTFPQGAVGSSSYDPRVQYTVGTTVSVDNFDVDRWNECSTGIHFFITRGEAERHAV